MITAVLIGLVAATCLSWPVFFRGPSMLLYAVTSSLAVVIVIWANSWL